MGDVCGMLYPVALQPSGSAELAQSVERTTLNRVVVGSIPTFGVFSFVDLWGA